MAEPAGSVLVTRPEPGGVETAARLVALGWQPLLAPALVLAPRPLALPPCQAVLLTSRAAARALPAPIPGLPLLAVGEATAEAARELGWKAEAAEGTAADLARLAAARFDPAAGPLLLAVGQGYALDLATDLRARGFRVLRRIAYAARPAKALPEPVRDAFGHVTPHHVLFHSPRSAGCAITLFREAGYAATIAGMSALAISPRVAEAAQAALAPLRWRALRVAARPTEEALLALLGPAATGSGSQTLF
ncbi:MULTISPECIES: uroporphyrinogen-III synthase [Roseomonadaceae]|uniref:Uroporphyrinogen-III synthase n=1 Tax=Falsiroseomonas oleicola TaxID=2801474 RepID=A0ABS6HGL8_9PROT|nr:uroporphyrinogen-III synthase [Roseomonas oleicola]MBU8546430.1 uroporphyrinogen-III synthase [Roseomonas oleicola]